MIRSQFLALTAALQAGAAGTASQSPFPGQIKPLPRSLILSGGGALGAYEAGAVAALVRAAGVGEGQPLPAYGVVAGTSIGALNAYLVATAQWSKLAELWATISDQHAVRYKPQYAKIGNQSSGVLTRLAEVIALGTGAGKNVLGVYDGAYLEAFLSAYIDFSRPVVTPVVWAVTNLTTNLPEYFYLVPASVSAEQLRLALDAVRIAVGSVIAVRPADPTLLARQLRASAAVPIAFDPVVLSGPDGKPSQYADGGITANTPIGIGRALASAVDVVLLSPPFAGQAYRDILEVTLGSYGTMQRRLMADALQAAVTESFLFRLLRSIPKTEVARLANDFGYTAAEITAFSALLSDTSYFVLQPEAPLPATIFGFDDARSIQRTYELGFADAAAGFKRFDLTSEVGPTPP